MSVGRASVPTMRLRTFGVTPNRHIIILDKVPERQRMALETGAGKNFLRQLVAACGASEVVIVPAEFGELQLETDN